MAFLLVSEEKVYKDSLLENLNQAPEPSPKPISVLPCKMQF